jgi:hypothetical protein
MTLFVGIPFVINLMFFMQTFRNIVFHDISIPVRCALLLCSLVPIWGVVLCVLAINKFIIDLKDNKILMRNNKLNRLLFKDKNILK